jgi:hypothetical protein
MFWHGSVLQRLRESDLFVEVTIIGAKVRASLSETMFLDIHYDPTTGSYSYALIDLTSPYVGDKRILGWDDYPHEGAEAIRQMRSYPHHFQRRVPDGHWLFEESEMRGDIEQEIELVLEVIRRYLNL